ncbi:MAG: extracellular solute-binding protein [bacterium]
MKKLILGLICLLLFTSFYITVTIDNKDKLYLLNWGEYVDEELIKQFEEENNVSVVLEEVGSSEAMYAKVSSGTTRYDIAIPGDYVMEKMYKNDLLHEIDHTKLTNYYDGMFNEDLIKVMNQDEFYKDSLDYAIPYFWGAYSILYSTNNTDLKEQVETNGFDIFFDRNLTDNVKIGMYDVPRWAISAYLLSEDIDVNTTDLSSYENYLINAMSSVQYDLWGNDILKKQIANGNLDVAFVQLGDFFDQHYVTTTDNQEVKFNAYVPQNTAAFFDAMVIPKTSDNIDLAHKFIDFFLDKENSLQNALYVGYCPTLSSVIEDIKQDEEMKDFVVQYPFYLEPLKNKNAVLFRDLGTAYESEAIRLINKAKN